MIKIFTTGGTIGGLEYVNVEDKSSKYSINISQLLKSANIQDNYYVVNLFNKDSRHITNHDRIVIKENIISSSEDEILITHGTYTMAETAKYLGKLNLEKIIILTGSFILGSEANTDAPQNIEFAIASFKHLENGVYIAINETIFDHQNVIKNIEANRFQKENE